MQCVIIPAREGEHYLEILVIYKNGKWTFLQCGINDTTSPLENIINYTSEMTALHFSVISTSDISDKHSLGDDISVQPTYTGFVEPNKTPINSDTIKQSQFVHPRKAYRLIDDLSLRLSLEAAMTWLTVENKSIRFLANNLNKMG